MLDRLTDSMEFSATALKLRAKRQEVLTSNITNADTPNYKAVDMDFRKALVQATGAGDANATADPATLKTTHAGHMSSPMGSGLSTLGLLQFRRGNNAAVDNNSVDLDRERAAFAENTVKYEAALRNINGRISSLKQAMGSGNQ